MNKFTGPLPWPAVLGGWQVTLQDAEVDITQALPIWSLPSGQEDGHSDKSEDMKWHETSTPKPGLWECRRRRDYS